MWFYQLLIAHLKTLLGTAKPSQLFHGRHNVYRGVESHRPMRGASSPMVPRWSGCIYLKRWYALLRVYVGLGAR